LIRRTGDSESRGSISCGILLFSPTGDFRWCVTIGRSFWYDFLSTTVHLSWMVVQVLPSCPPHLALPRLVGYPGYWLLLGKPDVIPCCTNFIRKDSGCWCNLNLKIIFPESRTRDFTVLSFSTRQLDQTDIRSWTTVLLWRTTWSRQWRGRVKCRMKCFNETRSLWFAGSRFWCNLNPKIISPESRTQDFTVLSWSTRQLDQTDIRSDVCLV